VRVGFLHVGQDIRLPSIMAVSAKRLGYSLLQMTDEETPEVPGCEVVRLPWDKTRLMTYRMRHLARIEEPLLVVDTDIVFLDDVSAVWDEPFDAALTKRDFVESSNGLNVAESMPYNTGVMFVRNPLFWQRAHTICSGLPEKHQAWWGDQLSVVAAAQEFDVLELPCEVFNYAPREPDDAPLHAKVIHYKGKRKPWMLEAFGTLLPG
jgi:lipopolysaccharide biosynthesis glycosyltransferase